MAASDWADSHSWCGKTRSAPPPWRSIVGLSSSRLAAWQATGVGDGALDEVRAALDNDLDTPTAVAAIDAAAAAGHGVSQAAALLGVTIGA